MDLEEERKRVELMVRQYTSPGVQIKWDSGDCDNAMIIYPNGSGTRFYTQECVIHRCIVESLRKTVNDPSKWLQRLAKVAKITPSLPRLRQTQQALVYKELHARIPEIILQLVKKSPQSDFAFMATMKRDWKQECSICLKAENIGTSCTCGHTEIVMIRPCGHTICARPCFADWMRQKQQPLDQKSMKTADGRELVLVGVQEVNLKNPQCLCPVCNSDTESTFAAEDVELTSYDSLILRHKKEIYELINS